MQIKIERPRTKTTKTAVSDWEGDAGNGLTVAKGDGWQRCLFCTSYYIHGMHGFVLDVWCSMNEQTKRVPPQKEFP